MKATFFKKIFLSFFIGVSLVLSGVFAYTPIDQQMRETVSQQCMETKNLAHYVGQSVSYGIFVKDGTSFNWYLNNHPTSNGQPIPENDTNLPYISKIYFWNPYGVLSSSPTSVEPNQAITSFYHISNVKPKDVARVKFGRQFAAMYTNTGGLNRTGVSAQINIHISKQQISSTSPQTPSIYQRFDENNKVYSWNYKINGAYNPTPKDTICMNFYVAKCGDGITDNPNQTGTNDIDGKLGIKTDQGIVNRINTGFTAEICDSTTSTGAACVNGTQGCCNTTCSGFGGGRCGDEIINDGGTEAGHGPTYMSGDVETIETCDDGDWNPNTSIGNNDNYQLAACSSTRCELNTEPESFPEELEE